MPEARAQHPVIVVGAGPAGLAAAACLSRAGIEALVLETGEKLGHTWRSLYDRLHLHTVRALSALPGYPLPRSYPRYAARQQVVDYLDAYASRFKLNIQTGVHVLNAARDGSGWVLHTTRGDYRATALVSAAGIFSNPIEPAYAGREQFGGQVQHASRYRNADPFAGQRVLVVGVGNSGAEIAVDLVEHGVTTTLSIRAGANVVPRELLGVPIQRWSHLIGHLPRPLTQRVLAPLLLRRAAQRQKEAGLPRSTLGVLERPGVPVIGLELLRHTRAGAVAVRPGIERFTPVGVRFADGHEEPFDTVILATGYQPALGYLRGVIPLDEGGFPRIRGIESLDAPGLYFIGLRNDIRGTLYNIAHEAPLLPDLVRAYLAASAMAG